MVKHAFVVGSLALVVACGEATPQAKSRVIVDGSIARASVVSPPCGSRATLIELPEHCAWPESARRTMLLDAQADVVVDVDEQGRPRSARVVAPTSDRELDAALAECAMRGRYAPAWNGAGETCPTRVRLARYASDVAPRYARLPGDCTPGVGGPLGSPAISPGGCTPEQLINPTER